MAPITTNEADSRERIQTAQQVLTAFFILAKTARLYETNNDSFRGQLKRFCDLMHQYIDDRLSCTVKVIKNRLFVDDSFVNIDSDDRIGVRAMLDRWSELGVGGMVIGESFTPDDITAVVQLLWSFSIPGGNPFEQLSKRMVQEGVDSISFLDRTQIREDQQIDVEERQRIRRQARDTFFRAITTVKNIILSAEREEPASISQTKRVVHSIIDQISQDESALMELASIRDFDEYTYAHSVNVGIYALTLGHRLGLGRRELSELGFAALFHDIGKVRLPRDLVTKAERFDEDDWVQMRQHPVLGALTIAGTMKLDSYLARAMSAAFEHHINSDGSGYPALPDRRQTNLYSRIIAIADTFDAMTSGRVYIKHIISPVEALRKMMYNMAVKFDTFLLKLFVNIIGIFPIGCLVILTDNRLGIVTRLNKYEMSRPVLRLIADRSGVMPSPEWFDLADPANRSVDIVRCLDPEQFGVDVTAYILTD